LAEFQKSRRTRVQLIYDGADISEDIAPFLLSFEYTDKSSGECDDLQISLEDREGLWRDPWFPAKGSRISAKIVTENWDKPDESLSLYCGSFEIDEIEVSEAPMTVSIKAVSAPRSANLREEAKNKNWEGYKLSGIAGDIAGNAGLSLEYLAPKDPRYDTRNQSKQSDLSFLMELCRDAGLALKVTDMKIVIFDEEEFESHSATTKITRGDENILSMSVKNKTAGTYKSANVRYNDTEADETVECYVDDDTTEGSGQTLQINQRVKSAAEAEDLAKSKLHEANKNEVTGSFNLVGDLSLAAGVNVEISGYGVFDGVYFVDSAKHSVGGSGYATAIDIREGTASKREKVYGKGYYRNKPRASNERFNVYTDEGVKEGTF
jgi:phage protein D